MVTPPIKHNSQVWGTDEKRSLDNNARNNRWTSQSPDVIEEEKGADSNSNRGPSINKQNVKVFPLEDERGQYLTNAQIYC